MLFTDLQNNLRQQPRKWLVTGAAGFIGSNLLESLLKLDQAVTGLDNLSSGYKANLEAVRNTVKPEQWAR
ncbi:MAG TPA: NAD-dependent epimerase/dehydratase family protein, partial [Verrucomicrobiae bacterium]